MCHPVAGMGSRLGEALVGLGVLASAVILAAMVAVPFLPAGSAATPSESTSASATAAPSGDARLPPLGTYALRGIVGFNGRCLGMELTARAYPVALGAVGEATVYSWQSGIIDPGDPAVCTTRVGDLSEIEATVTRIADEDDPDGPPTGYAIRFHLPAGDAGEVDMEILILAAQSTQELIQALDMTTSGNGLVFERVPEIAPPEAAPSGG